MRPVAVLIGRERAPADEVDELGDALIPVREQLRQQAEAVACQVVVPLGNARIDDGDADAGAGVAIVSRTVVRQR